MPENPYEPPLAIAVQDWLTIDRAALALRIVLALQMLWIGLVGAMARGFIEESSVVFIADSVMLFGFPALALWLAGKRSRGTFLALAGIQLLLFATHLLALLPGVQ